MLDTEQFDLAILDVMMPGVDGSRCAATSARSLRRKSMPVCSCSHLLSADKMSNVRGLAGANH